MHLTSLKLQFEETTSTSYVSYGCRKSARLQAPLPPVSAATRKQYKTVLLTI